MYCNLPQFFNRAEPPRCKRRLEDWARVQAWDCSTSYFNRHNVEAAGGYVKLELILMLTGNAPISRHGAPLKKY